jgi:hypothetical protein
VGQPETPLVVVVVDEEEEVEVESGLVVSPDALAVVVTVVSSVVKLVGRTGGAGVADVEVVEAGQFADPHSRLLGQHPPPSEAAHER